MPVNISHSQAGDGWEELCSFLHRPIPETPYPRYPMENQVTPKIQVEQRGSVPARLPQIPSAFMDASCLLHPCRPCTANSPLLMSNIFILCRLNHACSDHCLLLQLQPSHGASAVVSRHWSHLCVCGMEGRTKAK